MENTELLGGSIQPLCSFDDSCVYNLTLLAWPSAATLCPDPHEKRRSFHERYATAVLRCACACACACAALCLCLWIHTVSTLWVRGLASVIA